MTMNPGTERAPLWRVRTPPRRYTALAVSLAAIFLILALRGVDVTAAWKTAKTAQPAPLAAAAILFSLAGFSRSLRWRALLSAHTIVPPLPVFWATMAGYVGNNFLPLRAGEVIRSILIGSVSGIHTAFVLATAVMERVADTLVLLVLLPFVLPQVAGLPPDFSRKLNWLTTVLMAGLVVIPILIRRSHSFESLVGRLRLPQRGVAILQKLVSNFSQGMGTLFDPRRATVVILGSLAAWALDSCAATLSAHALGLRLGPWQAFTLLALLGLSSALPSTPGYLGIYQFVAVTVLCPFGFSRSDALAYIVIFQTVNYAQVVLWGGLGMYMLRNAWPAAKAATPDCR